MKKKYLSADASLLDAVRAIEGERRRIAIVASDDGKLLGTITDGDVRRTLLAGGNLEIAVGEVMSSSPVTARLDSSESYLIDLMRKHNISTIPLVDQEGYFHRLAHISDLSPGDILDDASGFEFAVIMAGGEGTRLRPLTESMPKPMVDICGTPLLERQILRLARAGIKKIYISLNYLGHVIEDHFRDGKSFGVEICYLKEVQKLGTAGALSLLPITPSKPILVMNGDILTKSDFSSLYSFHIENNSQMTVAAVDYWVRIPFGVIQSNGSKVTALVEKPSQRFLCNAGIYAVSPDAFRLLPKGTHINMTDLVELCLSTEKNVSVFPVHEQWSDIGTPADLENARNLYSKIEEQQ